MTGLVWTTWSSSEAFFLPSLDLAAPELLGERAKEKETSEKNHENIWALNSDRPANEGEVGDDLLGVLGLSSSRLAGNEDGLVLALCGGNYQ